MIFSMTGADDFPEALLSEQQRQVWYWHEQERLSIQEMAHRLGLSCHRVRQVKDDAARRVKDYQCNGVNALSLLPGRVRHVLINRGLTDRDLLKEAILSGRLWWKKASNGHVMFGEYVVRNAGWDSWVVMHDWARLPRPIPPPVEKRVPMIRPLPE